MLEAPLAWSRSWRSAGTGGPSRSRCATCRPLPTGSRFRSRSRASARSPWTPPLAATVFVMADARALGFDIRPDEARDLAVLGRKIVKAANAQLGFVHPDLPEWTHFSFAFLTGELEQVDGCLSVRNACVVKPGKIDRSPTGTAAAGAHGCPPRQGPDAARRPLHRPSDHREPLRGRDRGPHHRGQPRPPSSPQPPSPVAPGSRASRP